MCPRFPPPRHRRPLPAMCPRFPPPRHPYLPPPTHRRLHTRERCHPAAAPGHPKGTRQGKSPRAPGEASTRLPRDSSAYAAHARHSKRPLYGVRAKCARSPPCPVRATRTRNPPCAACASRAYAASYAPNNNHRVSPCPPPLTQKQCPAYTCRPPVKSNASGAAAERQKPTPGFPCQRDSARNRASRYSGQGPQPCPRRSPTPL